MYGRYKRLFKCFRFKEINISFSIGTDQGT